MGKKIEIKVNDTYFTVETKFIKKRDMTLYFINIQDEDDREAYPTTMLGYICGDDIDTETLAFFAKRTILEENILQSANSLSTFHQKDRSDD